MNTVLVVTVAVLATALAVLVIKALVLNRSLDEITEQTEEILKNDTNNCICISSGNKKLRRFASRLNGELAVINSERKRLQNGDARLKEAITNISHDIRTPLTAIFGYLDLLDREEKSEAVEKYALIIRERSEALCELSEELFKYSLAISPQTELKLERLDVNSLLQESIIAYYAALTEKNIIPELDLPDEPVFRMCDRKALMRVFENVMGNALKYSDGNLKIELDENATVRFTNGAKNLDAVTVGKLFDRYYTVQSGENSTGLGLSIAKHLTEEMGGSITASLNNSALTVTITLR